jgi:tRNA(fMet)-specific endonuclease VapC
LKYLVDTNIISEIIAKKPNQQVIDFLNNINTSDIYLSAITVGEIKYGINRLSQSKRKTQLLAWFEQLLLKYQYNIIDIDISVMAIWADINSDLKSNGISLSIMDSLIASSALYHDMTLVTRNTKDFQYIANLNIINPFKGQL